MNEKKSYHDRVAAVVAGQKVEELKARHAYLHGMQCGREEYGTFWLKSDNTSFGHGFGRFIGMNEMVQAHFGDPVKGQPSMEDEEPKKMEGRPEGKPEGKPEGGPGPFGAPKKHFDRPTKRSEIYPLLDLYGHNPQAFWQSCHVLASPVIQVAEDGKSARSFYMTPGTMLGVNGMGGGRNGGFLWERYGSDFVYRDGRWWWFHEQVCPDIGGSYDGSNWAMEKFQQYDSGQMREQDLGGNVHSPISDLRHAHNDITIVQTVQDTVPVPTPYEKMDEEHTYSPGHAEFEDIPLYPNNFGYGTPIY